jgi:hypothetical protein
VRLVCRGCAADAAALRVLGHAHQAWNEKHLSFHARNARLHSLLALLRACLHVELDSASASAFVAGRSTRLLGFTRELLLVMCANIEARMQLLAAHPGACRTLVCRSLSTDDTEGEFALLVGGIGFKPSPQAAEAYLRRAVDFLYHLRRQGGPDYGLAVPKSTKSAYSYHEAAAEGDATWNDGQLLLEAGEEAKMLARAQRKAEVALKQSKEVAIRSHHAI